MRETKLALMIALASLALYGCGDGGSKKNDGAAADGQSAQPDGGSTLPDSPVASADGGGKTDVPVVPVDGGGKTDLAMTPVDGALGGEAGPVNPALDAPVVLDGATVDGAVTIDTARGVDGATAIDAPATTDAPATSVDGSSSTGTCGYPQCYIDLVKNCVPSGACQQQSSGSGLTTSVNACYANGVKVITATEVSITLSSVTTTITTKNAQGVCYSLEAPYAVGSGNVTYTMKNAAGTTVATVATNTNAKTTTITCTGGSPVVVPTNCNDGVDAGNSSPCTTGTCAP
jgi:hypothetical protein